MVPRWLLGCVIVFLLVACRPTGTQAQLSGGPGIIAYGQNYGVPYPQALPGYFDYSGNYGYYGNYSYPGDYGYYGDMYAPQYWAPAPSPYAYFGPGYPYYPGAYGYGYPPPWYAYPRYPVYPALPYRPYAGRPYRVGPYIAMSLRQYLAKQVHGPTRVRDIVPGVPGLDR